MSGRILRVVAMVSMTWFSAPSMANQPSYDWKEAVEMAVAAEVASSGVPSLQISIGKKDEVIFQSTYGMADIENSVRATNKSKYRTGSVSKWFTSVAAKALIANGTLDPEEPIQKYCPQFPKKQWPITTINLLDHSSGIRHYIDYEEKLANAKSPQERVVISRDRDRDLLSSYTRYVDVTAPLESFKNDPLLFEPGTDWLYSSFAYRVLACVLEGATKMTYSEIMDEFIFTKANMTSTVKDDAWAIIPDRTTGYRLDRTKVLRRADFRDTSANLPAGGHLSTAADLSLFALALNSGAILPDGRQAPNPRWDAAAKVTIGQGSSWRNAIPSKQYYGVGEMYFPDKSRFWVGHTGRISGGSAIVVLQPQSDLAIAVIGNAKGWNGYISFIDKIKLILEESSDLFD